MLDAVSIKTANTSVKSLSALQRCRNELEPRPLTSSNTNTRCKSSCTSALVAARKMNVKSHRVKMTGRHLKIHASRLWACEMINTKCRVADIVHTGHMSDSGTCDITHFSRLRIDRLGDCIHAYIQALHTYTNQIKNKKAKTNHKNYGKPNKYIPMSRRNSTENSNSAKADSFGSEARGTT
jgi:hypothetical protein